MTTSVWPKATTNGLKFHGMPRALTIKLEIFQVLWPSVRFFVEYEYLFGRDKQTNMPEKDILEFCFERIYIEIIVMAH